MQLLGLTSWHSSLDLFICLWLDASWSCSFVLYLCRWTGSLVEPLPRPGSVSLEWVRWLVEWLVVPSTLCHCYCSRGCFPTSVEVPYSVPVCCHGCLDGALGSSAWGAKRFLRLQSGLPWCVSFGWAYMMPSRSCLLGFGTSCCTPCGRPRLDGSVGGVASEGPVSPPLHI